jgi:threonine/homoserine/homoserine lactone efflux protein
VYLLYLSYATWRDKTAFAVHKTLTKATAGSLVTKAIFLNILNPKLTIFFLAFLPQFIAHDAPAPLLQLLTLSGVFMAMTLTVFVIYGLLANAFRKAVLESPGVQAWLRRSFAAAFAGLAVNLAFSER